MCRGGDFRRGHKLQRENRCICRKNCDNLQKSHTIFGKVAQVFGFPGKIRDFAKIIVEILLSFVYNVFIAVSFPDAEVRKEQPHYVHSQRYP